MLLILFVADDDGDEEEGARGVYAMLAEDTFFTISVWRYIYMARSENARIRECENASLTGGGEGYGTRRYGSRCMYLYGNGKR